MADETVGPMVPVDPGRTPLTNPSPYWPATSGGLSVSISPIFWAATLPVVSPPVPGPAMPSSVAAPPAVVSGGRSSGMALPPDVPVRPGSTSLIADSSRQSVTCASGHSLPVRDRAVVSETARIVPADAGVLEQTPADGAVALGPGDVVDDPERHPRPDSVVTQVVHRAGSPRLALPLPMG